MRSRLSRGTLLACVTALGASALGSGMAPGTGAAASEAARVAPRPAAILNEGAAAAKGGEAPARPSEAPAAETPAKPAVEAVETGRAPASPAAAPSTIVVAPVKQPLPESQPPVAAEHEQPAQPAPEKPASETKAVATPPPPPPAPTLVAEIDLTRQRMMVSEGGRIKYSWPISSGRAGYLTPTGSFRPSWMAKMWYSKQYDDAPMPHAVFFNKGIAVHGTHATGLLGRPASHGCVRLSPSNAATFYALVNRHTKARTRIKVTGKTPTTAVAQRREPRGSARDRYASAPPPRQARPYPPPRVYAPPRYSYNDYARGGGFTPGPRFVYPGDPIPHGYRAGRPLYRPYGGPRVYYVD